MFKISGFYYKIDSKYDLYIRVETEFGSENHDLHFFVHHFDYSRCSVNVCWFNFDLKVIHAQDE